MNIILAADHRGFALKEQIKQYLATNHQKLATIIDVGAHTYNPEDDYVDYAIKAFDPTTWLPDSRTILFCGSGHGMDIAANRHPKVRAVLGFNVEVVKQGREHEDANVLVLPADWTNETEAKIFVDAFLITAFSKEARHLRRLEKLKSLRTNY